MKVAVGLTEQTDKTIANVDRVDLEAYNSAICFILTFIANWLDYLRAL